ncbi:MAG: hypothetical protein JWM76_295 [Pseudonocardiales bacterium]|nr:hypothetical protein [Pseudonocardiales bacterium]
MYEMNEDYARERIREVKSHAIAGSERRYARRSQSAQRWERVSHWAAGRSARASRGTDM